LAVDVEVAVEKSSSMLFAVEVA